MQFASDSGKLVKCFLPFINKHGVNIKNLDKILVLLYDDISKGESYVSGQINKSCFKTHVRSRHELLKPKLYASSFIPENIRQFIDTETIKQLTYKCHIHDREVNIRFSLFSEDELAHLDKYDQYVRIMYVWLFVCFEYSRKKCAKEINIYIYLTSFKKQLPTNSTEILGPDHVNTAVTYQCTPDGEMVIYRKEEWMKVFIHETFHSYGLDLGLSDSKILIKRISKLFPIDSDFNIAESYTETWARIINSAFNSYYSMENKTDVNEFVLYMTFSLQIERLWSIYQLTKVLNFMGLSYSSLYGTTEADAYLRKNMYREQSNIFAYYVVVAILMNDCGGFLRWCYKHNTALLQFNNSPDNINSFMDLIEQEHDSDSLIRTIKFLIKNVKQSTYIKQTARMSAIEIANL